MKNKKLVIPAIFALLLITLFLAFPTIEKSKPGTMEKTIGVVEQVFELDNTDVVLKLKNHEQLYFINDGLQNGLSTKLLKRELTGKSVEIYYSQQEAPMRRIGKLYNIAKVTVDRTTFYSN